MFIRIKLPAKYGDLQSIKEENYPFNRAFREFMLSIIEISARENLSPYATFGRIEHALVRGESLQLNGESPASIDYREEDDTIVSFYKSSGYRQKETTLMFIKLLMKLCARYGNSIPEIIYLITNIDSDLDIDSDSDSDSDIVPTPIVKIRKVKNSVIDSSPKSASTTKSTSTTKPASKYKPTIKTDSSGKSNTQDTQDKQTKQTSSAGDLLARANKLKANADELSAGTTVTTNPLLNEFFDI